MRTTNEYKRYNEMNQRPLIASTLLSKNQKTKSYRNILNQIKIINQYTSEKDKLKEKEETFLQR